VLKTTKYKTWPRFVRKRKVSCSTTTHVKHYVVYFYVDKQCILFK